MRADELKSGDHFKLATDPRTLRLLAVEPVELWRGDHGDPVYAVCDADNCLVAVNPDSYVELVEPEDDYSLKFKVSHPDGRQLSGEVVVCDHCVEVYFDGYGTHEDNSGAPLVVYTDQHGTPQAHAYTERHGVDPTHRLNFASARV